MSTCSVKPVAAAILAVFLLALAPCGSGDGTTPASVVAEGTLAGKVRVGPLCPVEPCTSTVNPYEGLQIVVSNEGGHEVTRIAVAEDGTFTGPVHAGNYVATIEPCRWLGCQFGFEVPFSVSEGERRMVNFDIDTGIR